MLKKCRDFLRGGSTHQNKKKSLINLGPEMHTYFLIYVHLSIVAGDFGCESTSVTDKVNIRKQILYGHSRCRRAEGCIAMDGRHVEHLL